MKILLLLFALTFVAFLPDELRAQETTQRTPELQEQSQQKESINYEAFLERQQDFLFQAQRDLSKTHLGYLSIAIAVILGLVVIVYLFSFKPFRDEQKKHEKKIESMIKSQEALKHEIQGLKEKFRQDTEKQIKEAKRQNLLFGFELSSLYARDAETYDYPADGFFWLINAAFYASKLDRDDTTNSFLSRAKKQLAEIISPEDIQDLKQESQKIYLEKLSGIQQEKHKDLIQEITNLLEEKLKKSE